MSNKLQPKDIAKYISYGLKGMYPFTGGNVIVDISFKNIENVIDEGYIKPILLPISCLTQEITFRGEKIVPLVELYNLSKGNATPLHYKYMDVFSSNMICIDQGGQRLIYFQMHEVENDVRLHKGWAFKCYSTDLRNDNKIQLEVNNQNLLFELLNEMLIDYTGLIDAGLAVSAFDIDNPYI